MIKIYGIPNCDTVRRARRWLHSNGIEYEFHDYKKSGVPADRLQQWIDSVGWERLLNRRGTSWRRLDETTRNTIDEAAAIELMQQHPSMIRRPLVDSAQGLLVGFSEQEWEKLLR